MLIGSTAKPQSQLGGSRAEAPACPSVHTHAQCSPDLPGAAACLLGKLWSVAGAGRL